MDSASLRPTSASICTTNRMSGSALSNKCIKSTRDPSTCQRVNLATRVLQRRLIKTCGNPVMESFNRGEHVVASFLDVEKAFDNVWHNGLRYKIFQLDLPTEMTRWLSDFLVGRLIQVNVDNFFSNQINPKAGVSQGSVLSPLLS